MDKKNMLKKGILVGVGIAAYAQEKAKDIVAELSREGYLNKKEGQRIVRNICHEAEKSGKRVAGIVQKEMNAILKATQGKKGKR
ncbi:MAG TPA: hypothetical protein VJI32_00200 [Candidatus Nanoarchaeia archaeon]|nr:hypothetical protein [Candidatus Nanoarchaeia archaeon]